MAKYIFVIDTESYAGNFEREMCGYATGYDDEYAALARPDLFRLEEPELVDGEETIFYEIFDIRTNEPGDDGGYPHPCDSFPTPGWFNNGVGGQFREGQEEEAKEAKKQYCLREAERHKDSGQQARQMWKKRAEEPMFKYPCHNSVAIFFDELPSQKLLNVLQRRCRKFAQQIKEISGHGESVTITGFRLLEEITEYCEIPFEQLTE
jgi:hypothetical protein